jgi:hypothetical protein
VQRAELSEVSDILTADVPCRVAARTTEQITATANRIILSRNASALSHGDLYTATRFVHWFRLRKVAWFAN